MHQGLLITFVTFCAHFASGEATSICQDISGTWTSKTPTIVESLKQPTGPELSERETLGNFSHTWVLDQDGCRIHGTNAWQDTEENEEGLPLKEGNGHLHGFLTPMDLAVLSETGYPLAEKPIRGDWHASLLEDGNLHIIVRYLSNEGDTLLMEGLLEKRAEDEAEK